MGHTYSTLALQAVLLCLATSFLPIIKSFINSPDMRPEPAIPLRIGSVCWAQPDHDLLVGGEDFGGALGNARRGLLPAVSSLDFLLPQALSQKLDPWQGVEQPSCQKKRGHIRAQCRRDSQKAIGFQRWIFSAAEFPAPTFCLFDRLESVLKTKVDDVILEVFGVDGGLVHPVEVAGFKVQFVVEAYSKPD